MVVVHWRDHWSNDQDHDPPWADDCVNRSYGEVVRETDELLSIACSLTDSPGMTKYGTVLHVWKALVQKVETVE